MSQYTCKNFVKYSKLHFARDCQMFKYTHTGTINNVNKHARKKSKIKRSKRETVKVREHMSPTKQTNDK